LKVVELKGLLMEEEKVSVPLRGSGLKGFTLKVA
jgi:hypothetical protein